MIRAKVYFTCKHLDENEVQVDIGPHLIEDNGGCEDCVILVQNFLDDVDLASQPEFYQSVKRQRNELYVSMGFNVLLLLIILFMFGMH